MLSKNDKKVLALYLGFALLFIYPLIQAAIFYRDDLDRAITGQYGWRGPGRPLADILMKVLSASGHYNLDLFPYTMIASCIFIGGSSLLLKNHLVKMEVPHPIFVAVFLIFNPYMLQNIAYRYDSLAMALAFFLAVFAYTYNNKNLVNEISIKIISGVVALTLYQPCANIFIGLLAADIMIFGVKKGSTTRQVINLTLKKASIFILFYIIYMLAFSPKRNSRAKLIELNSEGFEKLSNTAKNLYNLVSSYFNGPVYIYFLIPILATIIFEIVNKYRHKKPIAPFFIHLVISYFIFLVSLMGPTIFLQDAPVLPRALVSFSVLLVIITIPIVYLCPKIMYVALIPVITTFAFSAQLSSAMKSQRDHESFVFSMISRDLLNYPDIKTIFTVGGVNIDERARLLQDNKPLIGYFLSPADQFLASFQLINKGFTQTTHGYGEESDNSQALQEMVNKGLKPVVYNAEYSIYLKDTLAVIKLGSPL